ncbi:MAG: DUF6629 family protein [Patescibacteria group bacterium]
MCFSAPVSFATSAVLAVVGVETVRHARPKKRYVALIPFLFAIQQAIEGAQWIVDKPSTCSQVLGYGFLFFAFLVWPSWVPFAVWHAESVAWRKRVLKVLFGIGLATSAYFLAVLITEPMSVVPRAASLYYSVNIPGYVAGVASYISVILASFFVSSDRRLRAFGFAIMASAAIAWIAFSFAFTSVWCFFSAALSVWLYRWGKQ